MKKIIEPYTEDGLSLRLIEKADLPHTLSWRNDPNHRCWFNRTNVISPATHLHWFKEYEMDNNDFTFIVSDVQNRRYGQLSIYNINVDRTTAEFGRFLVNPEYEGQGIMKKACKLALTVAKEILKLNKLILEVKPNNVKAIHIYKTCGFLNSGTKENDMVTMKKII